MKQIEKMTLDELIEWAEGHVLKELIKGNFHSAIFTVIDVACRWRDTDKPKKK